MAISTSSTSELVAVLDGVRGNLEWLSSLKQRAARIQADLEELTPSISGVLKRLENDRRELKRLFPAAIDVETKCGYGEAVVEPIIALVAAHLEWSTEEIIGRGREASLCLARHIAIYLVQKYSGLSSPDIGDIFDSRDHSTVLYGAKKIKALRASDPKVWTLVSELETVIEQILAASS